MSWCAWKRGHDVADVELLTHTALGVRVRLHRYLEASHHAPWMRPTASLIHEGCVAAHFVLAAGGVTYAQPIGLAGNGCREHRVASEPKNIVGIVVFCPFHRLVATVVGITPPD